MTIDKEKLQPLLWAVVGAWNAGDQDLQLHTDALDQFLGEHTVEQVALQLLAENAALLEALAKQVYASWVDEPGYVPWVEAGNSLKQGEARALARAGINKELSHG